MSKGGGAVQAGCRPDRGGFSRGSMILSANYRLCGQPADRLPGPSRRPATGRTREDRAAADYPFWRFPSNAARVLRAGPAMESASAAQVLASKGRPRRACARVRRAAP